MTKLTLPSTVAVALLTLAPGSPATGQTWDETQKLVASDGAEFEGYGQNVALSGDVALVGAAACECPPVIDSPGKAYVYRYDGALWNEEQTLLASDGAAQDAFGSAVAVLGDVAFVGAPRDDDDGADSGAVYVFRWDGLQWMEEQKLTASDGAADDGFGVSIALSGDRALIGANDLGWLSPATPGQAYVFRFDGIQWVEEQKLTASDAAPAMRFGQAVALAGNRALVGAPDDGDFDQTGSAYVFEFDGALWVETQKLRASSFAFGDQFGSSLALSGSTALVAAPGIFLPGINNPTGKVFAFRFDGTRWNETQVLTASDGEAGDRFGRSLGFRSGLALIGAPGDDDLGSSAGAAYVFRFDGATWSEDRKLHASDGAANRAFAVGVALSDDAALAGSPGQIIPGIGPGVVYAFDAAGPSVDLKINGLDAVHPDFVAAPGHVRLSIDMTAGSAPLSHYYFAWFDGTVYWITSSGLTTTPTPLATFTPVDLTDVTLIDSPATPGVAAFGWLMVDGAAVVASDFIVVVVEP